MDTYICSIILRVVTLPSTNFDGTTSATFVADSIGAHSSSTTSNNGQQEQLSSASSSESQDSDDPTVQNTSKLGSNNASTASFDVTFYHCETGQVWNSTSTSIETSSDGDMIEGCQLCSDVVEGEAEVREFGSNDCCPYFYPERFCCDGQTNLV